MNWKWKYCIISAFGSTVAADINPNHIVVRLLNSLSGILLENITQALHLLSAKNKYNLVDLQGSHGI